MIQLMASHLCLRAAPTGLGIQKNEDITLGRNGKLKVYLFELVRGMCYKYKILKKLIKYYINEYLLLP